MNFMRLLRGAGFVLLALVMVLVGCNLDAHRCSRSRYAQALDHSWDLFRRGWRLSCLVGVNIADERSAVGARCGPQHDCNH